MVVWENIQGWGLKDSNNLKQCEKLNLNSTKTGKRGGAGGHRKNPFCVLSWIWILYGTTKLPH